MDFTELKNRMQMTIDDLKIKLSKVRIGMVTEMMFSGIYIDYYDKKTSITEIAAFKKRDANTMCITPWDKLVIRKIMKAISASKLDVTPTSNGETITIQFSPVTGDKREKLTKEVNTLGEKAKVAIRNIRKEENQVFKKLLDNPLAPEFIKGLHDVQKITDDFIKTVDGEIERKEKELKR